MKRFSHSAWYICHPRVSNKTTDGCHWWSSKCKLLDHLSSHSLFSGKQIYLAITIDTRDQVLSISFMLFCVPVDGSVSGLPCWIPLHGTYIWIFIYNIIRFIMSPLLLLLLSEACPHQHSAWWNLGLIYLMIKPIQNRKNCFRYTKLMSHLNATICTTISYTLWVEWCIIIFLF
jgi:hypothetical protein